jgi:hypothetical protein
LIDLTPGGFATIVGRYLRIGLLLPEGEYHETPDPPPDIGYLAELFADGNRSGR